MTVSTRKRPIHMRINKKNPYYSMSYNGYISSARLRMAQCQSRCLGSDEYIYFKDGDEFNDDINNLLLVSHKELNKLNEIRRVSKQLDRLISYREALKGQLKIIQFSGTPCSCPKCMYSREARQASYNL